MTQPSPAQPTAPADAAVLPWARQRTRTQPPATSRTRRVVENLPDWEPLPPGEIVVHRPSRH